MRKFASILLFACFAIYHFGYYGFYYSHQYQLESEWHERIYGVEDLPQQEQLMEIPLAAPYMANQEEFQATNTSFEKDGRYYRAIKQRYQNDTLQIIYVPDTARKTLENTVQRWISSLTEDEQSQDQGSTVQMKLFAKDYLESGTLDLQSPERSIFSIQIGYVFSSYQTRSTHPDSPPPQRS